MLMPSIFGESLLDDFFDFPFENSYRSGRSQLMRTDIKDTDQGYEVTMNLPGVKKEDVKAELKDGYLTISASSNNSRDEKDDNGRYIRRERYSGSCSRSFYVGDQVTEADIKAKFENGTLTMMIPKKEVQPAVEDKKYIAIEG
ncbi:MAG: Hsp20/alpha crystallin family protein [Lachnospiraceae bacterium]|uniref:Hsp20/alpha crystallin family protein n=1 Tax=Candidatus Enterocloster excrementigallinarum TaxID=2838558 RepID=A0A9D2PU31_9FIRM|nr:Hsp20/alpha crystallin family protein [Lachnospiraceae bacterium]HJC66424.1 Hsp20/alpha crystallin family protein [Candidatus Enterocloster excrementigallinarum]